MSNEDRRQASPRALLRVRVLFLLVVPLLFLQIPLRERTEPYPAILLPSGAGLLASTGDFTARETVLVVVDEAGGRTEIEARDLLPDVPSNYHGFVIERGFGLKSGRDVRTRSLSWPGGGLDLQLGRPLTHAQATRTRDWLKERVRSVLGVDPTAIEIETWAVTHHFGAGVGDADVTRALSRTAVVPLGEPG